MNKEIEEYYRGVADRMLPFMEKRPVAVRLQPSGAFTRRDRGSPMRISSVQDLVELVGQGALAFHVGPVADSGEVWFALGLEPSGVPFEVVRLTALKLHLVLGDTGLDGLTVFDGDERIVLIWTFGILDPDDLPGDLWSFQQGVASALRNRLEKRLAGTPERDRIGKWLGWDGPVTRLEGEGSGSGVKISTDAMSPDGLVRVPFSLNEETLLAAIPVGRRDLYRFNRERNAAPKRAGRLRRRFEIPLNMSRWVGQTLDLHRG